MDEVLLDPSITKTLLNFDSPHKKNSKVAGSLADNDSVDVGMKGIYKSLTILGDEIIKKLDELLKDDLPGGIASLKPEDHTPEKTAENIVNGVLGLFPAYARQNPELAGEDLLEGFLETVRSGIKSGYDQAVGILGDLGAFQFDGVQSGIEKTMKLVDEMLNAYAEQYRKDNGLTTGESEDAPVEEAPVEEEESTEASA